MKSEKGRSDINRLPLSRAILVHNKLQPSSSSMLPCLKVHVFAHPIRALRAPRPGPLGKKRSVHAHILSHVRIPRALLGTEPSRLRSETLLHHSSPNASWRPMSGLGEAQKQLGGPQTPSLGLFRCHFHHFQSHNMEQ